MTREEAIAFFKDMNECTYGNLEAVEMAIKALEQEPCEDAISRQVAIDGADSIIARDTSGNNDVVKVMTAWKSYVEGLPPVTPQPKMGRWIDTDNYYQRWKCSECGCHTRDAAPPFCPNCGVKMEGDKR